MIKNKYIKTNFIISLFCTMILCACNTENLLLSESICTTTTLIEMATDKSDNQENEINESIKISNDNVDKQKEIIKKLYNNREKLKKQDLYEIEMPDYIAATGMDEHFFYFLLKDNVEYFWEYLLDPENFKVDYTLPDEEFRKKYDKPKISYNGYIPYVEHIYGLPFTYDENGFPIEHPYDNTTIINPNNGKAYRYTANEYTWEDVDDPIERYVPSDEELNEIAKMYSASFK